MSTQFRFENYTFDTNSGLTYDDEAIHLPPKERGILQLLLAARGQIVRKDELIAKVWTRTDASDESISRAVYRLRGAMQQTGGPIVVETVYRSGFRMKTPVHLSSTSSSNALMATTLSKRPSAVAALISAREFAARRSPEDLEASAAATQMAIGADPSFSAAWSMLAEIRVAQAIRSFKPPREASWLAKEASQAALRLDPESSPALAARGWVRVMIDHDYDRGLNDLNRAIGFDPDFWYCNLLRGWVMQAAGRHEEAIEMMRRALELNPAGHTVNAKLALYLMYAGRLDEALDVALELARRFPTVESALGIACIISSVHGRHEDAIAFGTRAFELAPNIPIMRTPLAAALAFAGRFAEARDALRQIESSLLPAPSAAIAVIYLALGDREAAIQNLLTACRNGVPQFATTRDDPRLASLHGDPVMESAWATIWQPGEVSDFDYSTPITPVPSKGSRSSVPPPPNAGPRKS